MMNLESVFEKNESNLIIFTLLCIILVVFHHLTRYIIFIQQKILPHPKRIAVTPLLQTIHNMLYIVLAKILLENHFLFYLLTFLIHALSFLYSINTFFFTKKIIFRLNLKCSSPFHLNPHMRQSHLQNSTTPQSFNHCHLLKLTLSFPCTIPYNFNHGHLPPVNILILRKLYFNNISMVIINKR